MRRPLAAFGLVFFAATLAALGLSGPALLGGALALLALLGLALGLFAKLPGSVGTKQYLCVTLAAALAAFAVRGGYDLLRVAPLKALQGTQAVVRARVLEVCPGYGEDDVNAALQVLGVENGGGEEGANFRVQVAGLPMAEPGDEMRVPLRFYGFAASSLKTANYAKGYRIGAALAGEAERLGKNDNLSTLLRRLQYAAGGNILQRLPLRLSGVAAAMSVGDRRFVQEEASGAYRAAGLSHLMVVSGLHLSLLCAPLYNLLARGLRSKKRASVLAMGFVALFMAFTGFTPSILRSGFVWLVVYLANLVEARADFYTSVALAALFLLLQNPYAAADVGLQLSFTAAVGAHASGRLQKRLRLRWADDPATLPTRALRRLALALSTSLCVTASTLPVLVASGMGVSLLAPLANLVVLPFVPAIVLCGFAMVLPLAVPVLNLVGAAGMLVGGLLLRFVEVVTSLCARLPGLYVPVGGLFALAVVLVVYFLLFLAFKTTQRRVFVYAAALVLCAALGLHFALSLGTVRVVAVGSGNNTSLVVIEGDAAAVVYRHKNSGPAIARVLRQHNVRELVLLADIRQTAESTTYVNGYDVSELLLVSQNYLTGTVVSPFESGSTTVTLAKQPNGTVACVDVAGYKIGCYTGGVSLNGYAELDVLVAGSSEAEGTYKNILVAGELPPWASPDAKVLANEQDALFWIRPEKSVVMREVRDGFSG